MAMNCIQAIVPQQVYVGATVRRHASSPHTCTAARRSAADSSEAGSTTRGRMLQGWPASSASTRRKPATRVAVEEGENCFSGVSRSTSALSMPALEVALHLRDPVPTGGGGNEHTASRLYNVHTKQPLSNDNESVTASIALILERGIR